MLDAGTEIDFRYSALLLLELFLTVSVQMIGGVPKHVRDVAAQSVSTDGASLALVRAHTPNHNRQTCDRDKLVSSGVEPMRLFMRSAYRRASSVIGSLERMAPDTAPSPVPSVRHERDETGRLSRAASSQGPARDDRLFGERRGSPLRVAIEGGARQVGASTAATHEQAGRQPSPMIGKRTGTSSGGRPVRRRGAVRQRRTAGLGSAGPALSSRPGTDASGRLPVSHRHS